MNIFLESVSIDEIRRASSSGFADGVIFEAAYAEANGGRDGHDVIAAIAQEFAIPICIEVGAVSSDEMYRSPATLQRFLIMSSFSCLWLRTLLPPCIDLAGRNWCLRKLVFNGAQAVLASKAGASMVRISLHDLDAQGPDEHPDAVTEIRSLLATSECECDVMVASPRTSTQFTERHREPRAPRLYVSSRTFAIASASSADGPRPRPVPEYAQQKTPRRDKHNHPPFSRCSACRNARRRRHSAPATN